MHNHTNNHDNKKSKAESMSNLKRERETDAQKHQSPQLSPFLSLSSQQGFNHPQIQKHATHRPKKEAVDL